MKVKALQVEEDVVRKYLGKCKEFLRNKNMQFGRRIGKFWKAKLEM